MSENKSKKKEEETFWDLVLHSLLPTLLSAILGIFFPGKRGK
jgi:hypothetical protein